MKLLLLTFVLLLNISFTDACSCFPSSSKETFCSEYSKWVSRVKVNSKTYIAMPGEPFGKIYYDVDHLEIMKGPKRLGCSLVTNDNTAGCGVPYLQVGKQYLIGGNYEEGSISLSLCEYVFLTDPYPVEWQLIPSWYRSLIRNYKCP